MALYDDFDAGMENDEESVEERFRKRNAEWFSDYSDYKPLLYDLLRKVVKQSEEENLERWECESRLDDAETVIADITVAMRLNWPEAPRNRFWWGWSRGISTEKPKEWDEASPIDAEELDTATAEYLTRPWMQLDRLDWYIINGFVIDEILRLSHGIRSGSAFGPGSLRRSLSTELSRGKPIPYALMMMGLGALSFILNWLLIPGIALLAYFYDYQRVAKWLLIIFGIQILLSIILSPWRINNWRKVRRLRRSLTRKLEHLLQIYENCRAKTINPTVLRDKIAALEKDGILVKPAVYSILGRAIDRDPAVFVIGS
jgi:hypothetical protein